MLRSLSLSLILAGALLAIAGCGGSDSSSSNDNCQKICDTTASLKCPKDDAASCVSKCQTEIAALPACKSQYDAALACSAVRPVSDWECDATDGTAQLKENVCMQEALALLTCAFGGGTK